MSEKDINRWQNTITPRDLSKPWTIGSGGSWDMQKVEPIPDSMLAELAQRYHCAGTPWNCRSLPLSPADREYMYLLYYSMQGLVSRMLRAERQVAEFLTAAISARTVIHGEREIVHRSYKEADGKVRDVSARLAIKHFDEALAKLDAAIAKAGAS